MMDDYKNSDNFQRTEGCKMISPHHSHPTNGVSNFTSILFIGFILFVMLGLPFEASAAIPHFKEGSIAIIKTNEKDLFDFSQDGKYIWLVSCDGCVTNCYTIKGEKVSASQMQLISPPLERLSWILKMPNWYYSKGHRGINRGINLKRDDSDNRILPNLREIKFYTGENAQLYPYGIPWCFEYSPGARSSREVRSSIVYRTDFKTFTIERIVSFDEIYKCTGLSFRELRLSQSSRNALMRMYDRYEDSIEPNFYLYSGDTKLINKKLVSEMKKFTMNDMRRRTDDDDLYTSWGAFLSENIVVLVYSSAYSRTSFAGRCYVFLYDFRLNKIFWQRRSSREFPWNDCVAVCWCNIAMSYDERFLAVQSDSKIYVYKMK